MNKITIQISYLPLNVTAKVAKVDEKRAVMMVTQALNAWFYGQG